MIILYELPSSANKNCSCAKVCVQLPSSCISVRVIGSFVGSVECGHFRNDVVVVWNGVHVVYAM
jgi:hypothetical protein